MNPLWHAIAFMTRIPVPKLRDSSDDWQKSAAYYPIVGLLIGLLLWGGSAVAEVLFPDLLAAVLTIVVWVYLTGGLHLDGWMDLADGLGSSQPREEMLRIMKDSRSGALGVIAAILLLMVKTAAVYEILQIDHLTWMMLPPIVARFMLIAAIWHWPYAVDQGIGSGLRKGLNRWQILAYTLGLLATVSMWQGMAGLIVLLLTLGTSWRFAESVNRRLGGLTGDVYGALVEWSESMALVLIVLAERWMT